MAVLHWRNMCVCVCVDTCMCTAVTDHSSVSPEAVDGCEAVTNGKWCGTHLYTYDQNMTDMFFVCLFVGCFYYALLGGHIMMADRNYFNVSLYIDFKQAPHTVAHF